MTGNNLGQGCVTREMYDSLLRFPVLDNNKNPMAGLLLSTRRLKMFSNNSASRIDSEMINRGTSRARDAFCGCSILKTFLNESQKHIPRWSVPLSYEAS